ncbi:transcriptional repressor [Candidatus Thorarchaeota archaeon]|nr:MAG: transcriptional repressor [Candidatus Thorarchaeota archaeon]
MAVDREEIAETIRDSGHRATYQRILIYEALWNAGSHPTVAEIYEYAQEQDPSISLATVYKALQLFSHIGLAQELATTEGGIRYDPTINLHVHLVCKKCGKIIDHESQSIKALVTQIAEERNFLPENSTFNIEGICPECQDK